MSDLEVQMWVMHHQVDFHKYKDVPIMPTQAFLRSTLLEKGKIFTDYMGLQYNSVSVSDDVINIGN